MGPVALGPRRSHPSARPRRRCAGRGVRPCGVAMADRRRARHSVGVALHHGSSGCPRTAPGRSRGRPPSSAARNPHGRARCRSGRRPPRRAPAAHAALLPPGARRRLAFRTRAPARDRDLDRRDRSALPRSDVDDGSPDHPGQTQDRGRRHPARPAGGSGTRRSSRGRGSHGVPRVHGGLCAWSRPRPVADRPCRRSRAPRRRAPPTGTRLALGPGPARTAHVPARTTSSPGRRRSTRTLADQDRSRWRHDEIATAAALLDSVPRSVGYAEELRLQAVAARAHAVAPSSADTEWAVIAQAYAALEGLTGSPVVRLNRAIAMAEVGGPTVGLELLESLDDVLAHSHRLHATRAELAARAGDLVLARAAYTLAIERCGNDIERAFLTRRRDDLADAT